MSPKYKALAYLHWFAEISDEVRSWKLPKDLNSAAGFPRGFDEPICRIELPSFFPRTHRTSLDVPVQAMPLDVPVCWWHHTLNSLPLRQRQSSAPLLDLCEYQYNRILYTIEDSIVLRLIKVHSKLLFIAWNKLDWLKIAGDLPLTRVSSSVQAQSTTRVLKICECSQMSA
jgi:hypothetical protein